MMGAKRKSIDKKEGGGPKRGKVEGERGGKH